MVFVPGLHNQVEGGLAIISCGPTDICSPWFFLGFGDLEFGPDFSWEGCR